MKKHIAITLFLVTAIFAFGQRASPGGGSTTPQATIGGSAYNPGSVAITGGSITNTTVYGYSTVTPGSLGIQASNSVAISGGAIRGTTLGGLTYPAADGTTNQVLSANGNGVLTFKTVAAGGVAGESVIDGSRWFGWMTGYGSTVSNAAAPIYWTETGANGDDPAFGFTSSDTVTLQSRYAFSVAPIAQSATGWKAGGSMTVVFRQSSDSAVTNTMALRLSVPGGATWATNLVAGAANTITTWTVPIAALPTFIAPTGTSNVTFRCDFQEFAGATNAILVIKLPWQ